MIPRMQKYDNPQSLPAISSTDTIESLNQIAGASVKIAELGPKLAALAADMEMQARKQAQYTSTIAGIMNNLAHALDETVASLRESSNHMDVSLATIGRIAYQTRLLSLNAAIEAARAGAQGSTFAVVVDEIRRLSDNTGQTTQTIEKQMMDVVEIVKRIDDISRIHDQAQESRNIAAVNRQVREVASSAEAQLVNLAVVHSMTDQMNSLSQSLLLAVGRFRFDAHAQAEQSVANLAPRLIASINDRWRIEACIEEWLHKNSHFELAYITDAHGRQFVDNIHSRDGKIVHDSKGLGCDWSTRPWFKEALRKRQVCSTDIYRSTATGDFCFTVAVSLRDSAGSLLGVFGSDVNFQLLVGDPKI